MKALLLTLAGAAALMTAPAFAEAPADPKPAAAEEAVTHEQCKPFMGRKMDGKAPHQHSQDKMALAPGPAKPLSEAEMKRMHARCAAMMAAEDKAPAQPK